LRSKRTLPGSNDFTSICKAHLTNMVICDNFGCLQPFIIEKLPYEKADKKDIMDTPDRNSDIWDMVCLAQITHYHCLCGKRNVFQCVPCR